MSETETFARGTVVRSAAGRDAGYLLCVVGAEDGLLLLCDGKERPLERPKRKKQKHIRPAEGMPLLEAEALRGNKALRRALHALGAQAQTLGIRR